MTNPNWNRRGASSSEPATGSTVNMSRDAYGAGCYWAYVAALFRAANNATPTPTMTPSATPTVTATVASMPSGVTWKAYYFAGAQRVAMRVVGDPIPANNGLFYVLGDHLGSTNLVVDEDGNEVAELRYKAWGETRFTSGSTTTDYRYTGQREEAGIGLYYYNARWYDPALGRFAQADTIVPGAGPMAWDRYAYGLDNPVKYSDPTGHKVCDWVDTAGNCRSDPETPPGGGGGGENDEDDECEGTSLCNLPRNDSEDAGGWDEHPGPGGGWDLIDGGGWAVDSEEDDWAIEGCGGGWALGSAEADASCGYLRVKNPNALVDPLAWEHIAVLEAGGVATIAFGVVMIQAGASICTSIIGCFAGAPVVVAGVGAIGAGFVMIYEGGAFGKQYLEETFEFAP